MRQHHVVLCRSVFVTPLDIPIVGGFVVEIPCLEVAFVAWYQETALGRAQAIIEQAASRAA